MPIPAFDPSQPFEEVTTDTGTPPPMTQPTTGTPLVEQSTTGIPKFDPNLPSTEIPKFDPTMPFEEVKQPNFAQNVGSMIKSGAGAVAGAVSEGSTKLKEGIIQGASRIPEIRFEDVKEALLGSLRDVDQATMNLPSEFVDMLKGLGRVPDATLQSLINVWNAAGQYDINLNKKEDPTLQIGSVSNLADKVLPKPETPSGKAVTLAGEFALGGKGIGAFGKRGARLAEEAPVKKMLKDVKRADDVPAVIKQYMGLDDLSKVDGFADRFPNMAANNVKTGKQASRVAGKIYDDLPKSKGFQSHLDVTKADPRTGLTYGDLIEEFQLSTPPEMLPAGLLKKIRPGPGPFTVADRYRAMKALREIDRTTNKMAFKMHIRKYIRSMRDLELRPGQADEAAKLIKQADGLYAEAMSVESIGKAVSGAAYKGKAYTENILSGKTTVKAVDVLKGLDAINIKDLELVLGPNWKVVRAALRKLGDEVIEKRSIGMLGKLVGGLADWRMISWLFGGKIVGTAPYHVAKALKASGK